MRAPEAHNCGCFPTGHHYPGIADYIVRTPEGIVGLAKGVAPETPWAAAPFCVIDFETTGRDANSDRIIEVGIVCFEHGQCIERYECLVNPGIPVPEEARAIHGITDEELANAPSFDSVFDQLVPKLQGRLAVAYNAPFDRGFLHAETRRLSRTLLPDCPALDDNVVWIDPLVWARELFKYEKGKKLTDMCQRLNITLDRAHRACGDAEAAGMVLLAMAAKLPVRYDDLIRLQSQYADRQEADFAAWRSRRGLT